MSWQDKGTRSRRSWLIIALALVAMSLIACLACWLVYQGARRNLGVTDQVVLEIAYTPEKAELFQELVKRFNSARHRTPSGRQVSVIAVQMAPDEMLEAALGGRFQAVSADSSVWLSQLDLEWQNEQGTEASIIGDTTRYAVSPVVVAMWRDVAQSMGYPAKAIGWSDLLSIARRDPDFKWSHPATSSASGLLATLAAFYAGAGKTRGLTVEDATNEATLTYVTELEKTVRYYGEGELAVMEQIENKGRSYLDAFVIEEQLVIRHNQRHEGDLVAIYPVEGTMWKDHPLVLLERPDTTPEQRQGFRAFSDFLLSSASQSLVLSSGYRPTDLSMPIDSASSPISLANGVDPAQPKTTLQIPSPAVISVVRDVWQYAKRKTNLFLVADVSGSMQGEKLVQAREAFATFLGLIKGDQERVGLIMFSSDVEEAVPLTELSTNRAPLRSQIAGLTAGGDTALLDAVSLAYERLQTLGDRERINAVVVMTDGKENNSRIRLRTLISRMQEGNRSGVPVVVFCVAYGADADIDTLESLSGATGGQTRRGSPETIQELYKILSTYF